MVWPAMLLGATAWSARLLAAPSNTTGKRSRTRRPPGRRDVLPLRNQHPHLCRRVNSGQSLAVQSGRVLDSQDFSLPTLWWLPLSRLQGFSGNAVLNDALPETR